MRGQDWRYWHEKSGKTCPALPITTMLRRNVFKTARIEITIAFLVPVLMLGLASAVNTGLPISWENAYMGIGVIFFLILISNGLNNIVDEEIDTAAKKSGSEKSVMYHFTDCTHNPRGVIIGVIMSSTIAIIPLLIILLLRSGYPVIFFVLFGLIMALEYNLPPLKLAYRPFPELTMLLPSAVVAVAGMQYILVSCVTPIVIYVGTAFGLFSATWFVWQSMIDYVEDKKAGKKTTPVYMGPINSAVAGIMYPVLGVVPLIIGANNGLPLYKPAWIGCMCALGMGWAMTQYSPNAFKIWKSTMLVSFVFGIVSSIAIIFGGI